MPHTPGIRRYIFNTLTVVSLLLLSGVVVYLDLTPVIALSIIVIPIIAIIEFRRIRRRRLIGQGRCPSCGYDLSGNVTGECPECGKSIGNEAAQI